MAINVNSTQPGLVPSNLNIGGAPLEVPTGTGAAAPVGQPRTATGISSLNVGDPAALSEQFSPEKMAAQMGLTLGLSAAEKKYIDSLSPAQLQGLQGVTSAFTAAVTSNSGRPSANIEIPDALQSRWGDFISQKGGGKQLPTDVNALVQWVLRESYMETTKDLYFYAEKVKFFNNCKKSIRDEMSRARDEMVKYAGKEDTEAVNPPFTPAAVATDFVGSTEASAGAATAAEPPATTKGELDAYIQKMEEKLNSVGDDAQLANVDLQNILQKQQQTIQMMSNISKMLNDTALAIIRKIGG
jgi:hypothetical protein